MPACPSSSTDLGLEYSYRVPHYGTPPALDWMYHSRSTCCGAIPANTWIEVTHSATPGDEACGAWFYKGA